MTNEQPSRPRRSGSNASPMGSTLAIVIAIAAVVVGFLILKNIRNNDDNKSADTTPATSTTLPTTGSTTTLPQDTTTTAFVPQTTGAKVMVANSSHQNGVAKQLTTALQGLNYTTIDPANGATKEALTHIQYKDGDTNAQAVAKSLALAMGVADAQIEVMPVPPQLADPATLADATVLVLLGDDKAGKTLDQMTAPPTADTTAPASGATTTAAP